MYAQKKPGKHNTAVYSKSSSYGLVLVFQRHEDRELISRARRDGRETRGNEEREKRED